MTTLALPSGLDMQQVLDAAKRDDGTGFCWDCGNEQTGCEPDMVRGTCEACGAARVYGAEQICLLLG